MATDASRKLEPFPAACSERLAACFTRVILVGALHRAGKDRNQTASPSK